MKFRPCIDIHNGMVKQIVGSSLRDDGDTASENYVAHHDAAWFSDLYKKYAFTGGHVIMLNAKNSPYYDDTRTQALKALKAYPGGLMAGGGIDVSNAAEFLDAGASHVIITSWLFKNGVFCEKRLRKLAEEVGRERIVVDLSCRYKNGAYYVVTDRWQTFTSLAVTHALLDQLSSYCDEFLVHGVDAEGKACGMEKALAVLLSSWGKQPVTYAGGIGSLNDLKHFAAVTGGRLDYTIGSALRIFGGSIELEELI